MNRTKREEKLEARLTEARHHIEHLHLQWLLQFEEQLGQHLEQLFWDAVNGYPDQPHLIGRAFTPVFGWTGGPFGLEIAVANVGGLFGSADLSGLAGLGGGAAGGLNLFGMPTRIHGYPYGAIHTGLANYPRIAIGGLGCGVGPILHPGGCQRPQQHGPQPAAQPTMDERPVPGDQDYVLTEEREVDGERHRTQDGGHRSARGSGYMYLRSPSPSHSTGSGSSSSSKGSGGHGK